MSYRTSCRRCLGRGCQSCKKSALYMPNNLDKSTRPSSSSSRLPYGSTALYMPNDLDKTVKQSSSSSSKRPSSGNTSSSRPSSRPSAGGNSSSQNPSRQPSESAPNSRFSQKSVYKSAYDIKMASRQTNYGKLGKEDQKEQDKWANFKLQEGPEGGVAPCPRGFAWRRVAEGYRCQGGSHLITDKVLAEGKGGYFVPALLAKMVQQAATIENNISVSLGGRQKSARDPLEGYPKWDTISADGGEWIGPMYKGNALDDDLNSKENAKNGFGTMPDAGVTWRAEAMKRSQGTNNFSMFNQTGRRRWNR